MVILPFHDWTVIEPELVTQSEGGIYLPAGVDEDSEFMSRSGIVVAVGPGRVLETGEEEPCASKVGDKVEFLTSAAKRVKIRGREHYVVRDVYVVCRYVEG